jgi:hypothetical protein
MRVAECPSAKPTIVQNVKSDAGCHTRHSSPSFAITSCGDPGTKANLQVFQLRSLKTINKDTERRKTNVILFERIVNLFVVTVSSILYHRQPMPPFTRLPSAVVAINRRMSNGLASPRASIVCATVSPVIHKAALVPTAVVRGYLAFNLKYLVRTSLGKR